MPTAFGFSRYGGIDVQEVLDVERPAPGAGELLVAVRAAGVNPVDWKIREGYLAEVMPLDLPAVLGREVAGVVEEVGQDVDGFSVHDEVLGTVAPGSGGYAEYTLVTASAATKKPPQVSFTDAAALPVAAGTAYDAIGQLALGEGESLLINGIGGGVGVAAAQLARDLAVFVLGTGSEEKRELTEAAQPSCPTATESPTGFARSCRTASMPSWIWSAVMRCARSPIWSAIGHGC